MRTISLFIIAFSLFSSSALAESYGYLPGQAIRLGAGFNPIRPDKVYPNCLKAVAECSGEKLGTPL